MKDEGPSLRGEGKGMTEYDKRVYGLGTDEKNREAGLASGGSDLKRNLQARLDDMISRQEALDTSTPEGRREWERLEESIGILDDRILGMGEGQVARDDDGFASRMFGSMKDYRLRREIAKIDASGEMPNNMDILLGDDRDFGDLTYEEKLAVARKFAEKFPEIAGMEESERYLPSAIGNYYQRRIDFARAGEEISSDFEWNVEKLDDGSIIWSTGSEEGEDLENNGDVGFVGTITKRPDGKYESSWYTQELRNMSRGNNWDDPGDSGDLIEQETGGGVFDTLEEAAEDANPDRVGRYEPDYEPDDRDYGFASRSDRPLTTEYEWTNFEDLDARSQDRIIRDHIANIDRVAQPEIDLEAEREFAIQQWDDDAYEARAQAAESLLAEINELWDQDADADNPFQRNGNLAYAEELVKNTSYVEDWDLAEARNIVAEVRERFEERKRNSVAEELLDDEGDDEGDNDGFASSGWNGIFRDRQINPPDDYEAFTSYKGGNGNDEIADYLARKMVRDINYGNRDWIRELAATEYLPDSEPGSEESNVLRKLAGGEQITVDDYNKLPEMLRDEIDLAGNEDDSYFEWAMEYYGDDDGFACSRQEPRFSAGLQRAQRSFAHSFITTSRTNSPSSFGTTSTAGAASANRSH